MIIPVHAPPRREWILEVHDDEETRLQYAGGLPETTGEESLAE